MVELKYGDCIELMEQLPDKSIDMILCDLPYGVLNKNNKNAQWDQVIDFQQLWNAYERIIKDNGAILLFCDGMFMADLMVSNKKLWRYNIVWDKVLTSGFLNANRMPLRQTEEIAVFYKKLPKYNPQFSIGYPLHSRGTSYKQKDLKNSNYGEFAVTDDNRKGSTEKYPTNLIKFQKPHPSVSVHQTQKPVDMLEYLIKTYTDVGDTVLDNCMGSGSTGVACVNTNRNFIEFELNEKYFNIANDRINEQLQDSKLSKIKSIHGEVIDNAVQKNKTL